MATTDKSADKATNSIEGAVAATGSLPAGVDVQDLMARLAKLEAAEKEVEALRAENERLTQEKFSSRRLMHGARPFAPQGGSYKFRIGPTKRDKEKYPHLETVEEEACDESELKRWYCATNESKPGSNMQIDPANVTLDIVCIDKRRSELLVLKNQLSALREKINKGSALGPNDLKLLQKYEAEVYNYPKEVSEE